MVDQRESSVPEDASKLVILKQNGRRVDVDEIVEALRNDQVLIAEGILLETADQIIKSVAEKFELGESLKLQAAFAGVHGHRRNIGKYFMSVNERSHFQFITPHSEGTRLAGMQLASFFCIENSTDGGETILMNVNASSEAWQSLRELTTRARVLTKPLTEREIVRVKGRYKLSIPHDLVKQGDRIVLERQSEMPHLMLVDVLARPQKVFSRILMRELYAYWDSIASIDYDSAREYEKLLRQCHLLKEPEVGSLGLQELDNAADRRIWHSGVEFAKLFKCKITRRLIPGDLIVQNNLTWCHAAANWTPGSGTRDIAASFA